MAGWFASAVFLLGLLPCAASVPAHPQIMGAARLHCGRRRGGSEGSPRRLSPPLVDSSPKQHAQLLTEQVEGSGLVAGAFCEGLGRQTGPENGRPIRPPRRCPRCFVCVSSYMMFINLKDAEDLWAIQGFGKSRIPDGVRFAVIPRNGPNLELDPTSGTPHGRSQFPRTCILQKGGLSPRMDELCFATNTEVDRGALSLPRRHQRRSGVHRLQYACSPTAWGRLRRPSVTSWHERLTSPATGRPKPAEHDYHTMRREGAIPTASRHIDVQPFGNHGLNRTQSAPGRRRIRSS